jgi:ribose-phosphate pyrophosphokinase
MVSTIEALLEGGCRIPVTVAATHALPKGDAIARLTSRPVGRIIATNSLAQPPKRDTAMALLDLAPLIAEAILRIYEKAHAAGPSADRR